MLRPVVLRGPDRGHWYYVRARSGRDDLAISNSIWVEPSRPEPTPVVPVVPPSTEPSKAPTLAPSPGREKSWLRVTALDEAGRALPNARYTVSGPRGISYHSTTGDKPLQLTLGSWTLQVTQPGYQPVSRRISLRPGKVDYFTPVVVRLTLGAKPVEPKAIDGPSLLLPTPAPPPAEPKQETAAPPQQQQQQQYEPPAGSLVERAGETVRVHLACGEERSQELSYPLQAGESYVSATVRMGKSSNMGATVPKAVYDPETRKVSATIPLRGPKSNCEKGVDLDFHLAVTVRIAPKTKA